MASGIENRPNRTGLSSDNCQDSCRPGGALSNQTPGDLLGAELEPQPQLDLTPQRRVVRTVWTFSHRSQFLNSGCEFRL